MPAVKYSDTDGRVCRALRSMIGATYLDIARWTGIPTVSVRYLVNERAGIPNDNTESAKALLRWWFLQKLPTVSRADSSHDEALEIVRKFNQLLEDVETVRARG